MTMFPSMPQLHAQVIARMKERAHRPVTVGAIFFTTTSEAIERGRPTNDGIYSLAKDIRNQLVYEDPVLLHDRINQLNENEKKYKDSGFKPGADYLAIKKKLEDTSAELDARAATLPPGKAKLEYTYSENFFSFKDEWNAYYDRVKAGELTSDEKAGNEVLKTIDDFDAQYRQFYQGFLDLGYVAAIKPPTKSTVGDTFGKLPDIGLGDALNGIPWAKIGLFALGGLAIYWVINRKPAPTPLPEAPRRIGPPEATSEAGVLVRAHEGQ